MRRLPSLAVLAAGGLAVSLALPLTPASAAQLSRVVFQGEVAVGDWSTCPDPRPGDRCLSTRVITGDSTTRELLEGQGGAHPTMAGPSLVLQQRWYDVVADSEGGLADVTWREANGGVGVPGFPGTAGNPTAVFDTRLRAGTATATELRLAVSEESTGWETVWRSVAVRTSWLGSGPLERVHEGAIVHATSRLTSRSSTTGWLRPATATGRDSLSGSWGAFLGGVTYHVTQREAVAYRGHLPADQAATPSLGAAAAVAVLRGAAPSSSPVVRYRLSSAYGDAFWTTCAAPQAGDRCRDTALTYEAVAQPGATPERFAFLQVEDYRVRSVEDGWVDRDDLAVVTAKVPVTSLVAPADLSGAEVAVTEAPAEVCLRDLPCTLVPLSFQGRWQGTGPTQRFAEQKVFWGDWGREWVRLKGLSRTAVATASVSGLPSDLGLDGVVPGTASAGIATSTERHQLRPSGRAR